MIALLVATNYFGVWQEWLRDNIMERRYALLRLWSLPIVALLFAICWLVLFKFIVDHKNKAIAALFLVTGICILFYPSIGVTLFITQKIGISVNYFGNSVLFYSSALLTAMGLIGLLIGFLNVKDAP